MQADPEQPGHHLRAEQPGPVAKMGHQSRDDGICFNAGPERCNTDIREDTVKTLDEQKCDQDEVAKQRRL